MATLNFLIQIVGFLASLYLAFSRSLTQGVTLAVIVAVTHFIFSKLSSFLMLVHQRNLSEESLHELQLQARFGRADEAVPPAWRYIANTCGILYFFTIVALIWFFL